MKEILIGAEDRHSMSLSQSTNDLDHPPIMFADSASDLCQDHSVLPIEGRDAVHDEHRERFLVNRYLLEDVKAHQQLLATRAAHYRQVLEGGFARPLHELVGYRCFGPSRNLRVKYRGQPEHAEVVIVVHIDDLTVQSVVRPTAADRQQTFGDEIEKQLGFADAGFSAHFHGTARLEIFHRKQIRFEIFQDATFLKAFQEFYAIFPAEVGLFHRKCHPFKCFRLLNMKSKQNIKGLL